MELKEITKEELQNSDQHGLTVGQLKKFLEKNNLPDNAKVLVQRVEDVYYEKYDWRVYLKESLIYPARDKEGNVIKEYLEQYTPAWSCVKYEDEDDILFIDLHY